MTVEKKSSIPMLDLSGEIEELWDESSGAVLRVLRSGRFVLGPELEAFEREVAEYLGVRHAVGLNSGTDALIIGLRALGVGPGDEVITTAFSFYATAEAILLVGATPVFVDIREDSYNIDPDLVEAAVTERTRAILPVHLYGNPAAMTKIMAVARRHGLKVLEDCAQSFGAIYHGDSEGDSPEVDGSIAGRYTGAIGDAGAFSFYPTKNLGAYGDAGMLTTNDDEVARLTRMLRNHGASPERRYEHEMVGYNSRMDEFQAAILRVKLPHVERWNRHRRGLARAYSSALAELPAISTPAATRGHVFHQYTVRIGGGLRDALRRELDERGVATSIFYPRTLAAPAVASGPDEVRVARVAASQVLSLPIGPHLQEGDPRRIAELLRTAGGTR